MARRLGSAVKSPVLGLLLRTLAVASGVYFLRRTGVQPGVLFLFLALFWFVCLRPPFNNRKFLISALGLMALPILLPPVTSGLEWLLLILWTGAFFLLLGVKNLILLQRRGSYEIVHLFIVFGLGAIYLLDFLPLVPQIILFLALFLLFREFYFVLAPHYPQRLTLAAVVEAFLLVEVAWVLSFLAINFLAGAAFLALVTFIFHDLIFHHFQGALSRQIILRNVTLFVALSIVLTLLR